MQKRRGVGEEASCFSGEVFLWPLQYAGKTVREKLELAAEPAMEGAEALIVTATDELAWLFNVRGSDGSYEPLVISFGIVTRQKACWFVDRERCPAAVIQDLEKQGVSVKPYEQFAGSVRSLQGTVCHDLRNSSLWVQSLLPTGLEERNVRSPLALLKARKNPAELKGMVQAHEQDAVAVIKFLRWIDEHTGKLPMSELSLVAVLESFRKECPGYLNPSFPTISGFAENGASCHYRVSEETDLPVTGDSLYLVDSGGQYPYGTTDITRTIHPGTPDRQHQHHYTLVLKGHLALGNCIFPVGTCGEQLDVLARKFLWAESLNYGHGTGHGVGCYLCVHEGPQRISPAYSGVALEEGMVVSNEPGVYLEGSYGIRIENLVCVVAATNPDGSRTGFLKFMDLTLVPYARNLIDSSLLSQQEIRQVDQYHKMVLTRIRPALAGADLEWLTRACEPLACS